MKKLKQHLLTAILLATVLGLGLTLLAQQAGTGADAVANTSLAFFTTPGSSTTRLLAIASHTFNGSTWDRWASVGTGIGQVANTPSTSTTIALTNVTITALLGTVTAVKTSAGNLYGYDLHNPAAAACFVQIFDLAAGSVMLGTTTPDMVIGLPITSARNLPPITPIKAFANAISVASATTATGGSACGTANVVNFWIK